MILLMGVIRVSASSAIVPPPTERLIIEGSPPGAAVTIRTPLPGVITGTGIDSPYTVISGDTLWGIARDALARGGADPTGSDIASGWKAIYQSNVDVIGNDPNLILPGQVLTIPGGIHG
jgi:nucleoid-associated protein YgaU